MYIKFGFKLFKKNILLNIIIILQLSITIILTNVMVSRYNGFNEVLSLTKDFSLENTYLYMPAVNQDRFNERIINIQELLEKYKNEITLEQTMPSNFDSDDGNKYEIIGYGEKMSECLNMPIKKGCWFNDVETDDYIPCVALGMHELGDIINLSLVYESDEDLEDKKHDGLNEKDFINKESTQISEDDLTNNKNNDVNNGVNVQFKVVGIIDYNSNILKFMTSSNNPSLDVLFEKNSSDKQILLFNQRDLNKFNVNTVFNQYQNSILYLNSNNPQTVQNIVEDFQDQMWLISFKQAHTESIDQLLTQIEGILPLIISIFLVGIVSMLCLTLLNTYNNMRIFSIYYLCGMNWKSNILICLGYVFFQIFGTISLTAILFKVLYNSSVLPTSALIINGLNLMYTISIFIIAIISSLIAPYFLIRKEQPLKPLKESW